MERSYTDFLVPDCSFLIGAATVFSLAGSPFAYNRSASREIADARGIRQDFAMIGQDIREVSHSLDEAQLQLPL
jgi:hypothetical protein